MPPAYTVTRREFQNLFAEVRALKKMTVEHGTGLQLSKNRAGVAITKAKRTDTKPKRQELEIKAVAIVREIGNEDTSITVREIGYTDSPPESAQHFEGDEFLAYGYFGDVSISDYQGFEFTGDTPNDTTRVFDARKIGDDWILERPRVASGGVRIGKVVDILDAGSKVGRVQPYKVNASGALAADGAIVTLPYLPGYLGFQFEQHVGWGLLVTMIMLADGNEYIQQTVPWMIDAPTATAQSRCG